MYTSASTAKRVELWNFQPIAGQLQTQALLQLPSNTGECLVRTLEIRHMAFRPNCVEAQGRRLACVTPIVSQHLTIPHDTIPCHCHQNGLGSLQMVDELPDRKPCSIYRIIVRNSMGSVVICRSVVHTKKSNTLGPLMGGDRALFSETSRVSYNCHVQAKYHYGLCGTLC